MTAKPRLGRNLAIWPRVTAGVHVLLRDVVDVLAEHVGGIDGGEKRRASQRAVRRARVDRAARGDIRCYPGEALERKGRGLVASD